MLSNTLVGLLWVAGINFSLTFETYSQLNAHCDALDRLPRIEANRFRQVEKPDDIAAPLPAFHSCHE